MLGRSGTGLGLAVVWGTVKDHNGYIDVESTEEEGTTFELHFPVTRKEIESKEGPVSIEEYIGNGEKILEIHPNQKGIIASGFSATDRVKEAQRLGAGAYVKKPYTLEKIGLAVKTELGKRS